jgi:hypothetical protein
VGISVAHPAIPNHSNNLTTYYTRQDPVHPSAPRPNPHTHLQGPVWQGAGQRWLPQRSFRLHISSQAACSPSQQRRLQGWRPQALVALQRRSHSTSWWHCTALLVWPQRQVLVTVSRHTWVCGCVGAGWGRKLR